MCNFISYNRSVESITTNIPVSSVAEVDNNQNLFFCRLYIPCVLYFSRFTVDEKLTYSITFLVSTLLIFLVLSHKWIWSKRIDVLNDLFFNDEKQFSKTFFNIWEWGVKNEADSEAARHRIKNILTIGVHENNIKERIKHRDFNEKVILILWRSLGIFLSCLIILVGCALVVGLYVVQAYIKQSVTSTSAFDFVALFAQIAPGLGISLVNTLLPILFNLVVKFEKWDYNATILNQLIWRNCIFKVFTTAVTYFVVVYFGILGNTPETLLGSNTFDFEMRPTCPSSDYINVTITNTTSVSGVQFPTNLVKFNQYSNCVEDHVGMQLVTNSFIEWLVRKISPFATLAFRYILYKKVKRKKNWKSTYDLIDTATDMLVFGVNMYAIFLFFP